MLSAVDTYHNRAKRHSAFCREHPESVSSVLVAGEAATHRGRPIALSVEAVADERVGVEGCDWTHGGVAARVGGAEAATFRAEAAARANAAFARGAAEPEVGARGERGVEVAH